MESYAQLASLVIFFPAVGAFINFFWGSRLNERWSAAVGIVSALLAFAASLFLLSFANNFHDGAVVTPPFLDSWLRIESIGLEIPWQLRVDSLSVTMLMVVTGVGSLIHIYARGYMHGDAKFSRFFAYLNMFLAFMLILVLGNNFLVMFVGWEGVGLCSYLLIGFWWDKPGAEGWKNSNAGRKAFVVNRVGDFGLLMAIFLMFIAFGTLDFYRPEELMRLPEAELALEERPEVALEDGTEAATDDHAAPADDHAAPADEHAAPAVDDHGNPIDDHGAADDHAAEGDDHGGGHSKYSDNNHILDASGVSGLGIFGQAQAFLELEEGETLSYKLDADGNAIVERDRSIDLGVLGVLDIETILVLITLFMLLGAAGKSAQIPLFVWLPDAMAGPTPVSALIHAATMVTAGVYMIARSGVFFSNAPVVQFIVTVVGASTALMAGFIALGQWDIKRVLAYSTISQLGFMVAVAGLGGYVAAIFHLATHACFKALLFLGSGSVIHGVEHGHHHVHEHSHGDHHGHDEHFDPQDMRNMGGLKKRMPITFITYVIGALALSGIPPLAGFWSKDEILVVAWNEGLYGGRFEGYIAFALLLAAAGFTAFYMWRQIEMVFFSSPRTEAAEHAPESNFAMTGVLIVLAILTIFVGFLNVPKGAPIADGVYATYTLEHFLESALPTVHPEDALAFDYFWATVATLIGLIAIFTARSIYGHGHSVVDGKRDPLEVNAQFGPLWRLAHARLGWDEFYDRIIVRPFNWLARFFADTLDWAFLHDFFHDSVIRDGFNSIAKLLSEPFDLGVIDGIVNGVGSVVKWASGGLRQLQTGYVRIYAVALLLGVVLVIIVMLLPLVQGG